LGKRLASLARLWKERGKLDGRDISVDLISFLPASLEIVEKPPTRRPVGFLAS
jgi:hypothetical protein